MVKNITCFHKIEQIYIGRCYQIMCAEWHAAYFQKGISFLGYVVNPKQVFTAFCNHRALVSIVRRPNRLLIPHMQTDNLETINSEIFNWSFMWHQCPTCHWEILEALYSYFISSAIFTHLYSQSSHCKVFPGWTITSRTTDHKARRAVLNGILNIVIKP